MVLRAYVYSIFTYCQNTNENIDIVEKHRMFLILFALCLHATIQCLDSFSVSVKRLRVSFMNMSAKYPFVYEVDISRGIKFHIPFTIRSKGTALSVLYLTNTNLFVCVRNMK